MATLLEYYSATQYLLVSLENASIMLEHKDYSSTITSPLILALGHILS